MIQPAGVLLAGGRAVRMGGGDKGMLDLGGQPILQHVIDRMAPQTARLVLNANGDAARFAAFGLPVVPDSIDAAGPLGGVLAGLDWAVDNGVPHIVTAAADTPFLPCDLVPQLLLHARGGLCLAASPSGRQPTFGLWPVTLRAALRDALADGVRKVVAFTQAHDAGVAEFPDDAAFFNVNTADDLAAARAMA